MGKPIRDVEKLARKRDKKEAKRLEELEQRIVSKFAA